MNQCDVPDTFLTSCFLTRGHKLLLLVPRLPQLSSTLFCHANIREGNFFESQTSPVPTHPPPANSAAAPDFFCPPATFFNSRLLEKLVTALPVDVSIKRMFRLMRANGGGHEFESSRTNTQGLKITEEKVLPL